MVKNRCLLSSFSLVSILFNQNVLDNFGEGVRGTIMVERGVRGARKFEKYCFKPYRYLYVHSFIHSRL